MLASHLYIQLFLVDLHENKTKYSGACESSLTAKAEDLNFFRNVKHELCLGVLYLIIRGYTDGGEAGLEICKSEAR